MNRVVLFFVLIIAAFPVAAQQPATDTFEWAVGQQLDYWTTPNITYSTASGYECKLDVYQRRPATTPVPTVIHIHGGGWVGGTKEGGLIGLLPYFQMGFSVVNVEYRMARNALAPAAVEDCRLALKWVIKNAKTYNFDTTRIVVTGGSAGGHLALMTGMLNFEAGFDATKDWDQENPPMKVAAIINWFGITDVKDLLSGENRQNYAVSWIGTQENGAKLAERVSPLVVHPEGPAAHLHRARHKGPARPVRPCHTSARGARQGRRSQPAPDDPGREARWLHPGTDDHDLQRDP